MTTCWQLLLLEIECFFFSTHHARCNCSSAGVYVVHSNSACTRRSVNSVWCAMFYIPGLSPYWKVRSWWLLKVQRLKDYWLTKGIAGTCQEHTTWNTCKTRQYNIHSVVQVHLQLSHWGKEGRHLESSSAIIFDLIRSWSISLKQFTDGHII